MTTAPRRAFGIARFALWARGGGTSNGDLLGAAADLGQESEDPLYSALAKAIRFAAVPGEPTWEEARGLFVSVRDVRSWPPWSELLSPAVLPADLGPPPEEGDALNLQTHWLETTLARLAVEANVAEAAGASWQAAARRVAWLLDGRLRAACRAQLDHVENISRMRPELAQAGFAGSASNWARITLHLVPEGRRTVADAQVIVRCTDLQSRDGSPVEAKLNRRELRGGESADVLVLAGWCDPLAESFQVLVEVKGAGGYEYAFTWQFSRPSSDGQVEQGSNAPFPAGVPTAFSAAVEAIAEIERGVAVVSADGAVAPAQLVEHVGRMATSRVIPLDDLLKELGPGRRYRRLLGKQAILRALSGMDPHPPDGEAPGIGLVGGGASRFVYWPCHDTVERLLNRDVGEAGGVLREVLRQQAKLRPALVFVLPSRLAARFRRWSGSEMSWLAPATLDAQRLGTKRFDKVENEAVAWLQRAAKLPSDQAEDSFWRAAADLRVLHAWVSAPGKRGAYRIEDLDSVLREWGRVDLEALDPKELAALLVVSAATCQVSLKALEAGMVLAQEVSSQVRSAGSQPKTIGQAGMVITDRLVQRLKRLDPPPQTVWVGGITTSGGSTDLTSEGKALLAVLGGGVADTAQALVDCGLAEARGSIIQPTAFYQCVVRSALRSCSGLGAAYRSLSRDGHLLDGVSVGCFAKLTQEAAGILGIGDQNLPLAQAMGSVWSEATTGSKAPSPGRAQKACSLLTGQTAVPVSLSALAAALKESPEDMPLPQDLCTIVGVDPSSTLAGYRRFCAWLSHDFAPDWSRLGDMLDALATIPEKPGAAMKDKAPLLLFLGPGAETLPSPPPDRGIVVLRERDIRPVVVAVNASKAFWTAVRAHTGLARISPFVTVGALPPGSSVFVGRKKIRDDVLARVDSCSFLILGPRQIGKTSLLNAIYDDLRNRPQPGPDSLRPVPIFLSMQGVNTSSSLAPRVREICTPLGAKPEPGDAPIDLLRKAVVTCQGCGKRAVFVVNEIDGLLETEPELFAGLRDLHESHGARFVLVGYVTALEALNQLKSPTFHFTSGSEKNRFYDLSVLTDEEALELVDKLEAEPLKLSWSTPSERADGRLQLLQRSYRVPWVIQALCIKLVRLLDAEKRAVLRLDDVRRVATDDLPLLDHFDKIDLGELVGKKGATAVGLAGRAVLAQAAHELYFTGKTPPIYDRRLRDADPDYYAFTATGAREMIIEAANSWFGHTSPEARRVVGYFRAMDLARLLRGLTLTLIVLEVPSGTGGEQRYAFQHHIYPLELGRLTGGPVQRVHDALVDLDHHLAVGEGGTT